ncbi:hypothetical protein P308_06775 [Pseudomonas piscis]|nr:hypothetical protein P308_06775 [Pseudomonas piscis]
MGLPMCQRLLAAGYPLVVWNRNPRKCAPLVAAGARQVAAPSQLCDQADLVLSCLANTEVVREVVFGAGGIAEGARPGQLLLDLSSLEPAATREMAATLARDTGMGWVDAPVSGGTQAPRPAAWRSWLAVPPRMSSGCARCCWPWGSGSRTWARWARAR